MTTTPSQLQRKTYVRGSLRPRGGEPARCRRRFDSDLDVGQIGVYAGLSRIQPNAAEALGVMWPLAGQVKSPFLSVQSLWAVVSMALASFLLYQNFRRIFRPRVDQVDQPAVRLPTRGWNPSFELSDRRRTYRRAGNPSPVLIVGLDGNRRLESRIVDRSTAGLRLESPGTVPVDTVLLVRACAAPADCLWVPVEVRWCRAGWKGNLIGCRFIDPVPVTTTAYFG
jgi:hypothetical protein